MSIGLRGVTYLARSRVVENSLNDRCESRRTSKFVLVRSSNPDFCLFPKISSYIGYENFAHKNAAISFYQSTVSVVCLASTIAFLLSLKRGGQLALIKGCSYQIWLTSEIVTNFGCIETIDRSGHGRRKGSLVSGDGIRPYASTQKIN